MLLYFVSFLDRDNVGFAALSINKAIGLTPKIFGLGGGIFFLGYFLFEVPSNLILYRIGVRIMDRPNNDDLGYRLCCLRFCNWPSQL
jgi:ACS family tartrate transporter-like MFS transporter